MLFSAVHCGAEAISTNLIAMIALHLFKFVHYIY